MNHGLRSVGFLDGDHSDGDGGISEDADGERLGSNLLLVAAGRFDGCEELGFGFEGAVILDQDKRIVEDGERALTSPAL
jgi:hypothetical protein